MHDLQTHLKNYLEYCHTQKCLDEKTLKAYKSDLKQFFAYENNVLQPDICTYISYLNGHIKLKDTSIRRKIITLKNFYTYLGFRNKQAVCLLNELPKCKELTVVTDDGSCGDKDNAVNAYIKALHEVDLIIACGPPVMLKALKCALAEREIKTPCLVSLEERMGCGIGACLVCTCKKSDGGNARVCKDGPVFDINEVDL